jgi:taurine--2-oxoglutarate transaminase
MTGFGRTGKMFASEHWNVVPDIMTFAKGVNSGYVPLGGAIVDEPIAKHFENNVYWGGLTYSGHALACAAGIATLDAYADEDLVGNAARMGAILGRELQALKAKHPSIGDVRGRGLFWGIELVKDRKTKEMLEQWNGPSSALANGLKGELLKRNVYVFCRWNMLFVAPPLIIDDDTLRIGVTAIDEALELADRYAATGKLG